MDTLWGILKVSWWDEAFPLLQEKKWN